MGIAYNKVVERTNLILYWDTANLKCYTPNTQTLNDISGNGSHGQMFNTIMIDTDNSINLNGLNNFITGNLNCNINNYSISWWIKVNKLNTYNNAILLNDGWGSFAFKTTSDGEVVAGTDQISGFTIKDLPAKTVELNSWANYAFTYNNHNAKFYKNGVCISTKINMNSSTKSFTSISIGTNSFDTISGNVNSIMVYNSTLSDIQIQQNYDALSHRYIK